MYLAEVLAGNGIEKVPLTSSHLLKRRESMFDPTGPVGPIGPAGPVSPTSPFLHAEKVKKMDDRSISRLRRFILIFLTIHLCSIISDFKNIPECVFDQ